MRLPSARKSFMKPDTTDPFADVLALNSLPYLPPDSLLPGLPLLDQMKFIVVPLIPNEWFEDVAALLGVPSPLKAQIVLENTREGTIRIGPPEDPTFQRYYALCSAIHSIHSTAFLQLSRSLHQNTERRHRIIGRFQEIQAAIKKLQDLLAGPVEMKEWEEWDLPVARRLLAESLDLGQGGDACRERARSPGSASARGASKGCRSSRSTGRVPAIRRTLLFRICSEVSQPSTRDAQAEIRHER